MSDYAGNVDGGATGAEALGKMWGKLFTPGSAIVSNPTAYQVTQRGAGANMSVDIAPGAGLSALADYSIIVWSSAIINKTVTAADPTNPRNDIVVRYVDLMAYGPTNNVGATKFKIVSGIPAGSPTDPSNVSIQAAVGAGNPWDMLARIVLPANAPSVTNSYITDLRTTIAFAGLLYGGSNNTKGHTVPNVADDIVALLNAAQTLQNKNLSSPILSGTPVIPNSYIPQPALAQGYAGYAYVTGFGNGGNANVWTFNKTAATFSGLVVGRSYLVLGSIVGFYNNVANKNAYVGLYIGSTQIASAHQANSAGTFQTWPGSMMGVFTATSTSQNLDIWCSVDTGTTMSVDAMTVALI